MCSKLSIRRGLDTFILAKVAFTLIYFFGLLFTARVGIAAMAVAGGDFNAFGLSLYGTVWAWGDEQSGMFGDVAPQTASPLLIGTWPSDTVAVAAGTDHLLALKSDGTVWASGNNAYGQDGMGTYYVIARAQQIPDFDGVTAISTGDGFSLALKMDGTVWAWGKNSSGQLGNGELQNNPSPGQVPGLTGIVAVAASFDHALALKNDGTLWAWGGNSYGQLGDGTNLDRTQPVQVQNISGVTAIGAGHGQHSLAVTSDGSVWAWGRNQDGQLGNNSTVDSNIPVQVAGLTGATAVATGARHSLALKSDGTVWAWGYNYSGELGDRSSTTRTTPVQAYNLTGAVAVACGSYFSMALMPDGSAWAWGDNTHWNLGYGGLDNRYAPTQVAGEQGEGFLNLRAKISDIYRSDVLADGVDLSGLSGKAGRNYVYQLRHGYDDIATTVTASGGAEGLEMYAYATYPENKGEYMAKASGDTTQQTLSIPKKEQIDYVVMRAQTDFSGVTLTVAGVPAPEPRAGGSQFTDISLQKYEVVRFPMNMTATYRNMDLLFKVTSGDVSVLLDSGMLPGSDVISLAEVGDKVYRLRLGSVPIGKHTLDIRGLDNDNLFSLSLAYSSSRSISAVIFNILSQ